MSNKSIDQTRSKKLSAQTNTRNVVSVIILTFNSEDHIGKCLRSLSGEKSEIKEVIIVDNNSTDKTLDEIYPTKTDTKIIVNNRNLGFSIGINKGIKQACGEWILILNPDTIMTKGAIDKLLKCHNKTDAYILGGKSLKTDGHRHNSFVRSPRLLTGIFDYTNLRKIVPFDYFHRVHYYLNETYPTKPKEVDVVSGAFMLVNKDVFRRIGLFDENFFMYLEDIDFCIRAKLAGYKVVFCPQSIVVHEGGASSCNKDRINHQAWSNSRKYYFRKHFSNISNFIIQPLFIVDDYLTNIWRKLKSR